jgi:hypothetical protein
MRVCDGQRIIDISELASRLLILFLMSTGFGKMLFFNGFPDSHAWR